MKKIFLLLLLACSLKAHEAMQTLEASILVSDLDQAKETLTELTLSKKDRKRLLKLSDDIIARRQAAFAEHSLLNPEMGLALLALLLQIAHSIWCVDHLPQVYTLKDSIASTIDGLKESISQFPDSPVFPQMLEKSYKLQADNLFTIKFATFATVFSCGASIYRGYSFVKAIRDKQELLNTELINALMIYQLLYQAETGESQSS